MASSLRIRSWIVIALLFGAVVAVRLPAAAHAVLVGSEPSSGERVAQSPQTVTLTFDEPVETALGSLRVLDAAGGVRSTGGVLHPNGDARRVAVRVPELERGRYVVAWQVVSADSHIVSGAFAFGVDADAGPAPANPSADTGGQILLPILHFGILAGALLGIGMPLGILAFRRRSKEARYGAEFVGWCVLGFTAFADAALRADLAGGSLGAALTTRVGELRLATCGAAVAGIVSLVPKRRNWDIFVVAAIVAILSLSLAGHAGDGGAIGVAADALHLLAAATWIGLLAVATTLEPAAELRRLSPVAGTAVVVLVASGIVQTLRNAGSFAALLTTPYGYTIDLKIAGLLLALTLALGSRRALARGTFAIGRRIKLELWVLTAVIAVTAVLVESPLPRDAAPALHADSSFKVGSGTANVSASASDPTHWTFRITPEDSARLSAAEITVSESSRNVGPLPVTLSRDPSGAYSGSVTLPFAGAWSAFASARSGDFDENHSTFRLTEKNR